MGSYSRSILYRIRMNPLRQRLSGSHIKVRKAVIVIVKPNAAGARALQ